MTRSELIQKLAERQGSISFKESEGIIKHIFDQMSEALERGHRIEIRGFGSFSVRFREPRLARNPKTGASVQKSGKYSPYFRAGKEMRERVNLAANEHPIQNDAE